MMPGIELVSISICKDFYKSVEYYYVFFEFKDNGTISNVLNYETTKRKEILKKLFRLRKYNVPIKWYEDERKCNYL